jgi:hypothetical protein
MVGPAPLSGAAGLPWPAHEGLEAAIWTSRAPLIVTPAVIAAATLKFARSLPAATLSGVVAIAQPWTLLAGGSNLVPDGLTALAVVGGVLAASVSVGVRAGRARTSWLVIAVAAVVVASLTKETGAIGFLLVAIVVWNGLARPRRWMTLTALIASIPVVLVALVVANGPPEAAPIDLPRRFVEQLDDETFAGSPWIFVAAVAALGLIVWAARRAAEPLVLAGLALVAPALALGMYAAGDGLGMRNAVLLPYGLALILGALVADAAHARVAVAARASTAGLCLALVAGLVGGSAARAWGRDDAAERTWASASTRGVAGFLQAHRAEGAAACSLLFCSFYWLASDGDADLTLLPQYSARLGPDSVDDLEFRQRTGFRGPVPGRPSCAEAPLVVTKTDEGFGAIFECSLLTFVRDEKPRFLVVSGSTGADTFDAGRLIPYLEANPAFRRVYATSPAAWPPRVVAVYEVVGDPQPLPGARSYYSESAYDALPDDHAKPGVTVLDGACYVATIEAILTARPGDDAPAPAGGSCP